MTTLSTCCNFNISSAGSNTINAGSNWILLLDIGQFQITELHIRDFGLLCNHFVLYSYDLSQFEYIYKVQRVMPSLETQNLSEFSLVYRDQRGILYVSR